ncbi:Rv3235 family protein [Actinophytocola sp.]|uniref:Rv3235 family protein n=1 Tax=Actinophytocola sp. TaxID=1872138 RepID=UPI00389981D3
MTLPALPEDEYDRDDRDVRLRALPDYEPDEPDPGVPLRRWSSLRPVSGPQLRLAPPPQPPGRPQVPPAALVRVLRHVFEVLDGRRPVGQLRSLLPGDAFEGVLTRLRSTGPGGQHTLRSIHPCSPTPNAVEVAVVVDHRSPRGRRRVLAAAARFERDVDQWVCTVLRLL